MYYKSVISKSCFFLFSLSFGSDLSLLRLLHFHIRYEYLFHSESLRWFVPIVCHIKHGGCLHAIPLFRSGLREHSGEVQLDYRLFVI